jgi:hypothetical protein
VAEVRIWPWSHEILRLYRRYMVAGAVALPCALVYAYLRINRIEHRWLTIAVLALGVVLAACVWALMGRSSGRHTVPVARQLSAVSRSVAIYGLQISVAAAQSETVFGFPPNGSHQFTTQRSEVSALARQDEPACLEAAG